MKKIRLKDKYTKEVLEKLVNESRSIRQVLVKLNLNPDGMHGRISKLIKEYGLKVKKFGYEGKFTKDILEPIVKESKSIAEILRKLNLRPAGGTHAHIKRLIKSFNLDMSHFTGKGWNLDNKNWVMKLKPEEILIERKTGNRTKTSKLKRAMIESGISYICSQCKILPIWNNNPLTLEIDHIDNNWLDDRKENLRFLCPNCHSQTKGFRNKKRII